MVVAADESAAPTTEVPLTTASARTITGAEATGDVSPTVEAPVQTNRNEESPPLAPRLTPYSPKKSSHCTIHRPTLEELKSCTFSDYVRKTVLPTASIHFDGRSDEPGLLDDPMQLREGLAKVVLPKGFQSDPLVTDTTARGPTWQAGTTLGDWEVSNPIQQNLRGIAGVYEYTFTEQPPITFAEFCKKADAYRELQVGRAIEEAYDEKTIASLERLFWKRLGPTMPPPWYGADQEGSLFRPDDNACGWSLGKLDSCLHVLSDHIPGVTSSYLYAGMWASVFAAHMEDVNLCSINYLCAGAPKFWYAIAEPDVPRFVTLCQFHFSQQATSCPEFLRHKRCLLSPAVLQRAGIRFQTAVQYPGEAMLTMPASIHFGFNMGFNVAEATNFGVPEWLPFGRNAKVCICRPLAVRIRVDRLASLLERYEREQRGARRGNRLTWMEWSQKRRQMKEKQQKQHQSSSNMKKKKVKTSGQQRKNEFWVEVTKPVGAVATADKQKGNSKKPSKSKKTRAKKTATVKPVEIWHLAKPIPRRKALEAQSRVLCMVPGTTVGPKRKRPRSTQSYPSPQRRLLDYSTDSSESEEDDQLEEQCFAGEVVEVVDEHVRVHMDGMMRTEDMWIEWSSPKLFLDGGRWEEGANEMPALHYWQEMDSKRRCVDEEQGCEELS